MMEIDTQTKFTISGIDYYPAFAFRKGFQQIMKKDIRQCRQDIQDALGCYSRTNFLKRMKGAIEPRITEKEAIEKVFANYGIPADQVWGWGE